MADKWAMFCVQSAACTAGAWLGLDEEPCVCLAPLPRPARVPGPAVGCASEKEAHVCVRVYVCVCARERSNQGSLCGGAATRACRCTTCWE